MMVDDGHELAVGHRGDAGGARRPARQNGVREPFGDSDLWAAFVRARNRYRRLCETGAGDSTAVTEALERMNTAYRRWSEA